MKIDLSEVRFPDDSHWHSVASFLESNEFNQLKAICPVEFCVKLNHSFPYEWSYWNAVNEFELVILHKVFYKKQLRPDFLLNLASSHSYVFGNSVFLVYLAKGTGSMKILGDPRHNYLGTVSYLIETQAKKLKNSILTKYRNLIQKIIPPQTGEHNQPIKKILLVTANNCGNIGDDAITFAAHSLIQKAFPNSQIVVGQLPCDKNQLAGCQMVVLGGGGILYDHNFYNVQNYCQYLLYANDLGIKSAVIGVGAQDIYTENGIELYKQALDLAEFVAVRDRLSYQVLSQRVNISSPLVLNRDVVFYMSKTQDEMAPEKPRVKPVLLYSLLDPSAIPTESDEAVYGLNHDKCFQHLVEKYDVKLLVQSEDDLQFYKYLNEKYGCEIIQMTYDESAHAIGLYQQADLVVTSRLHGFIFAAIAQVPVICVTFDNPETKLAGIIGNFLPSSINSIVPYTDYSVAKLSMLLDIFHEDPDELTADPQEVLECRGETFELIDIFKDKIY